MVSSHAVLDDEDEDGQVGPGPMQTVDLTAAVQAVFTGKDGEHNRLKALDEGEEGNDDDGREEEEERIAKYLSREPSDSTTGGGDSVEIQSARATPVRGLRGIDTSDASSDQTDVSELPRGYSGKLGGGGINSPAAAVPNLTIRTSRRLTESTTGGGSGASSPHTAANIPPQDVKTPTLKPRQYSSPLAAGIQPSLSIPTNTTTAAATTPSTTAVAPQSQQQQQAGSTSDPRLIERLLTTPSLTPRGAGPASSASSTPRSWTDVAGPSGSGSISGAVVHWRLKEALASEIAFKDLWSQLSEACAVCYAAAGHYRNSMMYRSQQAAALLDAGEQEEAVRIYEDVCKLALRYVLLSFFGKLIQY